jgi:hypothetical protein
MKVKNALAGGRIRGDKLRVLATQFRRNEDHVVSQHSMAAKSMAPVPAELARPRGCFPALVVDRTICLDVAGMDTGDLVENHVELVVTVGQEGENAVIPFSAVAPNVDIQLVTHCVTRHRPRT